MLIKKPHSSNQKVNAGFGSIEIISNSLWMYVIQRPAGAESSGSTVEHDINPYYREIPWSLTRQHDFPILGSAWQGKNNSNRLPYIHISLVFPYLWNFTMRIAVWIKQTQFFLFPLLLFPSHLEGIKDIISH